MTQHESEERDYINGDQAANMLGVKKATLYAYVSRGVLRSFKQGVGRQRVYRRADIEALRVVRPSAADDSEASPSAPESAPTSPLNTDDVLRDVRLPDVETWAGDH